MKYIFAVLVGTLAALFIGCGSPNDLESEGQAASAADSNTLNCVCHSDYKCNQKTGICGSMTWVEVLCNPCASRPPCRTIFGTCMLWCTTVYPTPSTSQCPGVCANTGGTYVGFQWTNTTGCQ
jgi:hypothetical protein